MLSSKDYLKRVEKALPHGAKKRIADNSPYTESYTQKVLLGSRSNDDIVRAAENIVLAQGVTKKVGLTEYIVLSFEIATRRTETPFAYLKKEIFPFCFPGLNFSDN